MSPPRVHQPTLPLYGGALQRRQPPPVNERELVARAEALAGRTILELAGALEVALPPEPKRAKGYVGQLVERALGADPTAGERPDFPDLGVELKTIPIGANGRPAESTFCCSIRMADVDRQEWIASRLRRRLGAVLFLPIESAKVAPFPARCFGRARLWRPSEAEFVALRDDYVDLMGAIGAGRTPTGHEGRILQVRPKAMRATDRVTSAVAGGAEAALPLGFYLRADFTASVLAG